MNMYYNSVGHNTSLILGLTPDPDGLMPEPDVKSAERVWGGDQTQVFKSNCLDIRNRKGDKYSRVPRSQLINQVVIQEDIAQWRAGSGSFCLKGKQKMAGKSFLKVPALAINLFIGLITWKFLRFASVLLNQKESLRSKTFRFSMLIKMQL
jgi:hypothetical protein